MQRPDLVKLCARQVFEESSDISRYQRFSREQHAVGRGGLRSGLHPRDWNVPLGTTSFIRRSFSVRILERPSQLQSHARHCALRGLHLQMRFDRLDGGFTAQTICSVQMQV